MNEQEIRTALAASYSIPSGRQKSERLELLAAEAKPGENRVLEAEVLLALIRAYEYGAGRDAMPVPFGRLLRILDDHPAEVGGLSHTIHWTLKWMTYGLVRNPAVPLTTIDRWLDELESRYRQRGYSARPVLALRADLAAERGDQAAVDAAMTASMTAPRDEMADCDACERNGWGSWRVQVGDDEGALEFWAPVLNGERRCGEEPHRVLSRALLPLVRTGRIEEARSAYLKGYPLVRHTISLRESVGRFMEFCALTGNEARGLEILAEHTPWLTDEPEDVGQRLAFTTGVAVLLRRLSALGHADLRIGDGSVGSVLAALEREIAELSGRYDARNGNTVVSERIARRLGQEPLLDLLPLGVSTVLPRPSDAPARPTRAEALDELVAEARRLSAGRHPRAGQAWDRIAASGRELPDTVATEISRSKARALGVTDPGKAHAELLAVAERFARLGETGRALSTRSSAAVMLAKAGDRAAAESEALQLAAEAERAYQAGELTPADCLSARAAAAFIAINGLGRPPADADLRQARVLAEAELAVAVELHSPGYVALFNDMLGAVCLLTNDLAEARIRLTAALTHYLEAGEPWNAVRPACTLAQLALDDGDPIAAEEFAKQAIEHCADMMSREESAQLGSLLVETVLRQEGRASDLVGAALSAAARWEGLSEPDMLHNTFTAARAYHQLGRHAEAAALFEGAMPRVEVPYDQRGVALTRRQYGESLRAVGQHRDAAEQFLRAAQILQQDPADLPLRAELAWSAAESLQRSGQHAEALPAYQRAAELWAELNAVGPRVRCLRSAAWLTYFAGQEAERDEGIAAMRAVLAELESLAERTPSEEVSAELAETRKQLDTMLNPDAHDPDDPDE